MWYQVRAKNRYFNTFFLSRFTIKKASRLNEEKMENEGKISIFLNIERYKKVFSHAKDKSKSKNSGWTKCVCVCGRVNQRTGHAYEIWIESDDTCVCAMRQNAFFFLLLNCQKPLLLSPTLQQYFSLASYCANEDRINTHTHTHTVWLSRFLLFFFMPSLLIIITLRFLYIA